MGRPKRELKRVTVNLPLHVHEKILEYAEQNGLSFTVAVMILCVDALAQKELEVKSEQ